MQAHVDDATYRAFARIWGFLMHPTPPPVNPTCPALPGHTAAHRVTKILLKQSQASNCGSTLKSGLNSLIILEVWIIPASSKRVCSMGLHRPSPLSCHDR
jgi:hypothetical protein